MARWKARGRLPIGDNWTFSLAIMVEALWADIGRNCAVWKVAGPLWTQISGGKGASPTNDFWHQKTRVPELSYGEKIAENFNRLSMVHQRYRQTTDGRPIAYSEREREFTSAKKQLDKISQIFLYTLHVALAKCCSDGNAICYVLSALWMTLCFHIIEVIYRRESETTRMFLDFARWQHRGTRSNTRASVLIKCSLVCVRIIDLFYRFFTRAKLC